MVLVDKFTYPKLNDGAIHVVLFICFKASDEIENAHDSFFFKLILYVDKFMEENKVLSKLFGLELFDSFFNNSEQHLQELKIPLTEIHKKVGKVIDIKLVFKLRKDLFNFILKAEILEFFWVEYSG